MHRRGTSERSMRNEARVDSSEEIEQREAARSNAMAGSLQVSPRILPVPPRSRQTPKLEEEWRSARVFGVLHRTNDLGSLDTHTPRRRRQRSTEFATAEGGRKKGRKKERKKEDASTRNERAFDAE